MLNPLYQQLRSDLSTTETQIATLNARISETNKMIENEYSRARRIHGGEATLTKLTRDYQVNLKFIRICYAARKTRMCRAVWIAKIRA